MQVNTNIEPKLPFASPDRPLQHSMIQIHSKSPNFAPKTNINFIDQMQFQTLKRSNIESKDYSPSPKKNNNSNTGNLVFTQKSHHYQPITRDGQKPAFIQSGTTSSAMREYLSAPRNQVKLDSNPEQLSKISSKMQFPDQRSNPLSKEQLLKEVINELKDQYFPSLVKLIKKEVQEDIFQLKNEMLQLREQMKMALQKQQALVQSTISEISSKSSSKLVTIKDSQITQLSTHFFLLEGKVSQIQSRLVQQFKSHQEQLSELQAKIEFHPQRQQIAFGTLKSELPPILLQYKQLLSLKQQQTIHELTLNRLVYYIDNKGFLLDHENYYILDSKGEQIQLDEKHLKLLTQKNILQS